jgi:hypothetical protein
MNVRVGQVVAEAEFWNGTDQTWGKVSKMMLVPDVNQLMVTVGGDDLELDPGKLYTIPVVFVKGFEVVALNGMDFTLDPKTLCIHHRQCLAGVSAYTKIKPLLCESACYLHAMFLDDLVVLVRNHHVIAHKQQPMAGLFKFRQVGGEG